MQVHNQIKTEVAAEENEINSILMNSLELKAFKCPISLARGLKF